MNIKRRTALQENLEKSVLPFDLACTQAYAELLAKVRKAVVASTPPMPASPRSPA